MKTVLFSLLLLLSIGSAFSQDWQTDLSKAKTIATQENKTIILVFQGSDWCAPCMKLDKEIWSSEYFKNYAKSNYIMVQVDFPRRKQNALSKEQEAANGELAEKYNKNGVFPFVVVMDGAGNVLGETGYKKMTPEGYVKVLDAFIN